MCGIAAVVSLNDAPVPVAALRQMCAAQVHRGPDEAGLAILAGGRIALGSVRLSIIDLAGGSQPLFSEDDSIAAVCNGEIYDYPHQRHELARRGHTLRTYSDSELLLHWYEELGLDFIPRLNGEFAFVIWDDREQRLVAARDRAGVKPLYYARWNSLLLISSEIRGLFAAGLPRRLSADYVTGTALGVMDERSTPFVGVRCLPPGHRLVVDRRGSLAEERYFAWHFAPDEKVSFADAQERVRLSVTAAVQRRMVADVPVQCYLSGGLDSAIVCGLMAQRRGRFAAYHVSFPNSRYDESQQAAAIARHFGQSLETVECTPELLAENLVNTVCHVEQPLGNCNAIGKFLLSRRVRDSGDKVCLTGEGADEAFGGYAYFKLEALWRGLLAGSREAASSRQLLQQFEQRETRSLGVLWHRTSAWRHGAAPYGFPSYLHLRARENGVILPWLLAEATRPDALEQRFLASFPPAEYAGLHSFNATRKMAFQILAGAIIPALGDRVEMAHGIECRTPFLDSELLELISTIPPQHFLDLPNLREKHVLRAAFADLLPPQLQRESKHPFLAPSWRTILGTRTGRELLDHYLSSEIVRSAGFFQPRFVSWLRRVWLYAPAHWQVTRRLDPLIGVLLTTHILHEEVVQRGLACRDSVRIQDRTPGAVIPTRTARAAVTLP